MSRSPSSNGAATLTDRLSAIPYSRNTAASRDTSGRWSVSNRVSAAPTLTLLIATALIPIDASNRA